MSTKSIIIASLGFLAMGATIITLGFAVGEARGGVRRATETVVSCDGVTLRIYTDRTDTQRFLSDKCSAYEVFANQDWQPER